MNFLLNSDSKIYLVSAPKFATGGPELMHQLAFYLRKNKIDAYMYYYPNNYTTDPVHDAFKCYDVPYVDSVSDLKNNIIIVPETTTNLLFSYHNIQKVIWWLSIDNYYNTLNNKYSNSIGKLKFLKDLFFPSHFIFKKPRGIIHLSQSHYAIDYLKNKNINSLYLSDYLNSDFLNIKTDNSIKENIVTYNPKKGIEFTNKLIDAGKKREIKFVPIENMTRQEVIKLLQKAKVYIDFGTHPGKDRIPREAAILNCCVLTNKTGSAAFFDDVSIYEEFKFEDSFDSIELILNKIENCFDDFDTESEKYIDYKNKILNEERVFVSQVKNLFCDND